MHFAYPQVARILAGTIMAVASSWAVAQAYPSKTVRLVLPYAAGGGLDGLTRALAQKLHESLGQPFIVENRPGAGGIPGTDNVAKAAPDGYTLLVTASAHTILPSIGTKLPFDAVQDFAPITQLSSQAYVFGINPAVPARSVREFIALAKAKPGAINYGSGGNGNATHIGVELLKSMAGIDMVHIPYKGGGPAAIAIVNGEVDAIFAVYQNIEPLLQAGRLRVLAVAVGQRWPTLPDVPTVAEMGVPGFEVVNWYGMVAPAGTRKAVIDKVNTEVVRIMRMPDVVASLAKNGMVPSTSSPEAFGAFMKSEIAKWAKVIADANIQID